MKRFCIYCLISLLMGTSVLFMVYIGKGEYNFMAFPIAFILNWFSFYKKKK